MDRKTLVLFIVVAMVLLVLAVSFIINVLEMIAPVIGIAIILYFAIPYLWRQLFPKGPRQQ